MRHCDTAPDGIQVSCVTMDFIMQVGASHSLAWDGFSLRHMGGWWILKLFEPLGWLNQHTETEESPDRLSMALRQPLLS